MSGFFTLHRDLPREGPGEAADVHWALARWRGALAPGGHIAFSAPVLVGDPDAVTAEFWAGVPDVVDQAGIARLVAQAGFRTLATRLVVGTAWDDYYRPMAARIAVLRPGAGADLSQVLDEAEREIALWQDNPDAIACLLSVVSPG